ncbi:MAG: 13E12 repeat family protein [Actinomycetota bacterium]|nr:13E12 repeat family protein [Actinomycetota bacterium]
MLSFIAAARSRGERLGGAATGSLEASAAIHELSLALTVPVGTLQSALAAARLARANLPSVWRAWHAGTISSAHVGAIVEKAYRLRRPDSLVRLDQEVTLVAPTRTVSQLRRWLGRFVSRVEPDLAEQRHDQALRDRRVYVEPGEDGMSWLSALIPSVEAAEIDNKLERLARHIGSDDGRTHDQKRADVLAESLLGTVCSTVAGTKPGTNIGVVVPIQSLMGVSEAPGELADRSASVPASYIRSMALRPGTIFWRLLTGERGNLLDVARLGRFAPADLQMAIQFRDGTSVFPTSEVSAANCDADHTLAHPAPTTAANLGSLHRRAHRLKTEGLLSVRQPEPGVFVWTTSTGHTYQRRPEPLPVAPWNQAPWFASEFLDAIEQEVQAGYALGA